MMNPSRFLLCAISFVPSVIGYCNYTAGTYVILLIGLDNRLGGCH
jgi:hypothetical protein